MVQFDNRNLLEALEKNLSYNDELVDDIIRRCNHIMKHNHMKAIWDVPQANKLANSLVECAKRDNIDDCDTDLDPELCRKTWTERFGHIKPYLSWIRPNVQDK
jgi:hypothetical protein